MIGETEGKKMSLNCNVNQSAGSNLVTSSIRNHGRFQLITQANTYRLLIGRELSIATEINNSMFSAPTYSDRVWEVVPPLGEKE